MSDLLYSFDTSAFINGRRDLLPPEIFLTFWANIEQMIATGSIRAIDVVRELARAHGGIVVTEETPTGNLERPRIPDVCSALGVRCVNLIGFVRDQGWTF